MARSLKATNEAGRPKRARRASAAGPGAVAKSAKRPAKPRWSVYVLRCRDGTLYCGVTTDLPRRIAQHNRGQGARYTRGRGPVVLLKTWRAASQSAALKAEWAFKALSRAEKERRIASKGRLPQSRTTPKRGAGGSRRGLSAGAGGRRAASPP